MNIQKENVRGWLEQMVAKHPDKITARLREGDTLSKGRTRAYEIDDGGLDTKLGDFPKGVVPYGPIRRKMSGSSADTRSLFGTRSKIPLSDAFNAGKGQCLEKAALVQLAAQRGGDAYLINDGVLEVMGGSGGGHHAYNIVFDKGEPFLIDAQNPLSENHPYIAPVEGINKLGRFIVPENWQQGRFYSIT